MSEQFEKTWASGSLPVLMQAIAVLPPTVAVGSVAIVEWLGATSYSVRLSSVGSPVPAPPEGVSEESAAVAGVFMRGPQLPSPYLWLRSAGIDGARRLEVFLAMRSDPVLAAVLDSILLLQEVDSMAPEVVAGVEAARVAKAITEEEAAALLRR
jgi:hypothetical protein